MLANNLNALKKILLLLFLMNGDITLNACPYASQTVNLLQDLNGSFRDVYGVQKKNALRALPVIIVAKGDTLILYEKGKRTEVKYLPSLYHRYKEVSHVPVLLYLLIKGENDLSEFKINRLNEIKKTITSILNALQNDVFSGEEISHSENILNSCLTFIDTLLREKKSGYENQLAFFRRLGPLLLKNASQASFVQLDSLNTQVQDWKKLFPKEEWNQIAVVVMGPQMPRVGEVTMQYFARLTGKQLEKSNAGGDWLRQSQHVTEDPNKINRRLVYAEGLQTEGEALNLLATHMIDEDIGFVFFEDEMRMQCDLLSEGASMRLKEKCVKNQNHTDH